MNPNFLELLDDLPSGLAVPVWPAESEGSTFAPPQGGGAGGSGASANAAPFQCFLPPVDYPESSGKQRQKVAQILFFQSQVPEAYNAFIAWAQDNGGTGAWCRHPPEPPKGEHVHAVVRFPDPKRYDSIFRKLQGPSGLDKHCYLDKGGNFRKCLRYLLHLDSPDKPAIPRSELHTWGDWGEGELDNLLAEHLDFSLLFRTLKACQECGQSPEETCCHIVRMGYTMSQISQCVRAAKDVRDYWQNPTLQHPIQGTPF